MVFAFAVGPARGRVAEAEDEVQAAVSVFRILNRCAAPAVLQRWFAFDAATGRQRDALEVAQPFCQFVLYGLRVNVSRNQDDGIVRGIPFVVESAELSGFRRTDGGFAADGRITAVARALQQRGVTLQCEAVFSVLAVPLFVEDGFLLDLPVGRLELARPQNFGGYGQTVF